MLRDLQFCLLAAFIFLVNTMSAYADEVASWADPALPNKEGLILWLDATRPKALLDDAGNPVEKIGSPIASWLDASASKLRMEQKTAASRPTLAIENKARWVRFDGERTYLHAQTSQSQKELTIFIVATPLSNAGGFRAFLAASQSNVNDYLTGFNFDMGMGPTSDFVMLNYEGVGAGGIRNLKPTATDFGRPHLLSISSTPGADGVKLRVNGAPADSRARVESSISLEKIFVGGRYFRSSGPPEPTGFLDGDIAEVLVFNRVLDAAQIAAIEKYLSNKYGDMTKGTTVAQEENASAIAQWADPAIPNKNGLILWLDATRPQALLDEGGKAVEKTGKPITTWLDASPSKLRMEQKVAAARPKLEIDTNYRTVRFDGDKAFLQGKLPRSQKNLTIFLATAPHANTGAFRAFLAGSRPKANDYVTGFNIDMGMGATPNFSMLNYEGSGVGGIRNLKPTATEFSRLHVLSISSAAGAQGVKLRVNGTAADSRDRAESTISMETLIVGGRHFRGDGVGEPTGFLDGDIAEIMVFNKVLDDAQIAAIEKYLATKHGSMREVKRPPRDNGLKPLSYVPPVQMLVPAFRVRELPVDLSNINNVKYRADGKLLALAYNGNAYLLTDTDGDKVEDHVELFWDNQGKIQSPIGMALTPPNYFAGNGFFVASKGMLSLVVDTDGDNRADTHKVLADGWNQISHGVDALGVAYDDHDGSVYFGLGAAAFTNAYQLDEKGVGHYDIASERGTILRVDPRTKLREIVCTGIRFPVALAFNRQHDLFCTDQEGATWLPNGNPFDELLHIEPKRHYGFPPRHPRHLPHVVDEPNVCDYFPQHQSTCGLNFNESVNGGPVFGPSSWQDDAIVCGYTRGKLYRTQLIKTWHGYVSRNHLLGSLNMLTCDACVSPAGDLLIATHSGGPDWGSGPNGKGKLYNVRYDQPELPQPLAIWPQNAREVHIAFDRPLEPQHLEELRSGMRLSYGKYVAAGDRFEVLRPGYQVVLNQTNTPRYELEIMGVGVTSDRRTLVISTAPHPQQVSYAITVPALGRPKEPKPKDIKQYPETDLAYDLSGVAARWRSEDGTQEWSGWLPHADMEVARRFTFGSAAHDQLWQQAEQGGTWTLETALNLSQMLRPALQPGSRLDATLPPERVTIELRSRFPMLVEGGAFTKILHSEQSGMHLATLELAENQTRLVPLVIKFNASAEPVLSIAFRTNDDPRLRALQLGRFVVPWAAGLTPDAPQIDEPSLPPGLAGGNWSRGRKIFFGEQAACSKCHRYGGFGESVGPDLSNSPHRDYFSVMRDIEQPNFAINPDHLSHNIELKDGRILSGMIRRQGKEIRVTDGQARTVSISQDDIESVTPSAKSIMPEGLPKLLGPERMRDLLTFLLTPAPSMPLADLDPPAVRPRAEVDAVLSGSSPNDSPLRPLKVVLVAGKKDHGPGEHDYPAWQKVWSRLLSMGEAIQVTTAMDWPTTDDLRSADVIVFYQQGKWTPERSAAIDGYLARGGGLVFLHYAVDGGTDPVGMAKRIGLAWSGGQSMFREGPLEMDFRNTAHPIARNFSRVHFNDESYWKLVGDSSRINLLASAREEDRLQPQIWTAEQGSGRIFVSLLGHYSWTFDDPLFRVLLLRGIAWSAKESVDRFNDLVYPGARVQSPPAESKGG